MPECIHSKFYGQCIAWEHPKICSIQEYKCKTKLQVPAASPAVLESGRIALLSSKRRLWTCNMSQTITHFYTHTNTNAYIADCRGMSLCVCGGGWGGGGGGVWGGSIDLKSFPFPAFWHQPCHPLASCGHVDEAGLRYLFFTKPATDVDGFELQRVVTGR